MIGFQGAPIPVVAPVRYGWKYPTRLSHLGDVKEAANADTRSLSKGYGVNHSSLQSNLVYPDLQAWNSPSSEGLFPLRSNDALRL